MRRLFLLTLTIVAFLTATYAFADDQEAITPTGFGFSIGDWISPNFSGITKQGLGGTEISLNHNLGFTSQSIFVPHLWYRWSHGQIFDLRYSQYNQTVTTTMNAPEVFGSIVLVPGETA